MYAFLNRLRHSRAIIIATLVQTILLLIFALLATNLVVNYENNNREYQLLSLFKQYRSDLVQDIYIQSVIGEQVDKNLPSLQSFNQSLSANNIKAKTSLIDCSQNTADTFMLEAPNGVKKCLDVRYDHSDKKIYLYLLLSIIVAGYLISFPIYSLMARAIRREKNLKVKAETMDEVRHNITSPIATLNNAIYLMRDKLDHAEFQLFHGQLLKISSILENLKIQGVDTLKREEVEVVSAVREVIDAKKCEFDNNQIRFVLNVPTALEYIVDLNRSVFNTILSNLINNSFNAMNGNGLITIELQEQNRKLSVRLTDTGNGIAKEDLEKIFEKGFTKNTVGGTGSGLYQARYKLARFASTIEVASTSVNGTTFEILIPLKQTKDLFCQNTPIILLEDDAFLLKTMQKRILKEFPDLKDFYTFSNAQDLLQARTQHEWRDALYILDCQLGDDDTAGIRLARKLRELGEKRLCFFSGVSLPEFTWLGEQVKKSDPNNLIRYLRSHVHC